MDIIKRFIKKSPALYNFILSVLHFTRSKKFPGTIQYWENRYRKGGNSGAGSYNRLAAFKAEIRNDFVVKKKVGTVTDFGCGDGNNLALMHFPCYKGVDVSSTALSICIDKFKNDPTKSFHLYSAVQETPELFKASLSLSLDVIYHLIEEDLYDDYMKHLFASSTRYVIIYSRLVTHRYSYHEKGRDFLAWIKQQQPAFRLIDVIENKYRFDPGDPHNTSDACFYFFERMPD